MDWLVFYILVWPVISAGVLAVLVVALVRDLRAAKRDGHEMI
ncbi:putative transporter small subunit [Paenalcaligenes niemegkensis]|nr:putative transporter small subunit [Paenalcaligenes niemegkensis]MCQ9617498.1 putative transporter small subunit [Paenalcaligenes niemegkensis]